MWISILDEPIYTRGMDNKVFILRLCYHDFYGYNPLKAGEVITAVWSSVNECFYEEKTGKEVASCDIVQWWKEA